jgi:hypothetical protein
MIDEYGAFGGMKNWQGKPNYLEKTCPNATLSISLKAENDADKLLYGERGCLITIITCTNAAGIHSPLPRDDLAKTNTKTQLMDGSPWGLCL